MEPNGVREGDTLRSPGTGDQDQKRHDYTPQAILVTGGAGFIGSHVVDSLVESFPQAYVIVLDLLDYCASERSLDQVRGSPRFCFVKGDVRDHLLVGQLIVKHRIDTIMHFAAQSHVDNSFGNCFEFTLTNVYGTHVLLESARIHSKLVKRFVYVSTDEVYGETLGRPKTKLPAGNVEGKQDKDGLESPSDSVQTRSQSPPANARQGEGDAQDAHTRTKPPHRLQHELGVGEDSILAPTNPYAATKAGAEQLARAYLISFGVPVIITRGNNVFGPRQFPEKLIPKFVLLLSSGKQCTLHGSGQHKRCYLYVRDVAQAFVCILRKGRVGSVYNIGSSVEYSNKEVCVRLMQCMGRIPAGPFRIEAGSQCCRVHVCCSPRSLTKARWSCPVERVPTCKRVESERTSYATSDVKSGHVSTGKPDGVSDCKAVCDGTGSGLADRTVKGRTPAQHLKSGDGNGRQDEDTDSPDEQRDSTEKGSSARTCVSVDISSLVAHVSDRCYNDARYHIDSTSLRALGWSPEWTFDRGLRETVRWYAQHQRLAEGEKGSFFGDVREALVPHPRRPVNPPKLPVMAGHAPATQSESADCQSEPSVTQSENLVNQSESIETEGAGDVLEAGNGLVQSGSDPLRDAM